MADSDRAELVDSGGDVSPFAAGGVGVDVCRVGSGAVVVDVDGVDVDGALVECARVSCEEVSRFVGCALLGEGLVVTCSVTVTVSEKYAWVPPSSVR